MAGKPSQRYSAVTHDTPFPGYGVAREPDGGATTHIGFLGRNARTGSWQELSQGTFRAASAAVQAARSAEAIELLHVSTLEAQELREIYEAWPLTLERWLRAEGVSNAALADSLAQLQSLIGARAIRGIEAAWPEYELAVARAIEGCRSGEPQTIELIEEARQSWLTMHDEAVDRICGIIDIAVQHLGEHRLRDLWDMLLADWYEIHAERYDIDHQPWSVSAHQLMVSIVDGFHAHMAGGSRQGDIEIIIESDRMGFRFAPCGSGGRNVDPAVTQQQPRAGAPFNFAVTTEAHDWAWNQKGVCSYCVHCCLLNELMPIERLGYPTRVIDPPVWGEANRTQLKLHDGTAADPTLSTTCTWWVYRHPSLVPDRVYRRVGRSPAARPPRPNAKDSNE